MRGILCATTRVFHLKSIYSHHNATTLHNHNFITSYCTRYNGRTIFFWRGRGLGCFLGRKNFLSPIG